MNAPSPALVAPRPERLRLVGQRRQILAVMHQRLMFGLLVYAGIIAIIALRILWLAAFGDHAGRKEGADRADPGARRHRRPRRRAACADHRCLDHRGSPDQGHRRQARACPLACPADARAERRAVFRHAAVGQAVLLPPPPRLAGAGRGGQRAWRARPRDRARSRPALPADDASPRMCSASPTSTAMAPPAPSAPSTNICPTRPLADSRCPVDLEPRPAGAGA